MTNKQTISGSEETKEGAAKSIYQSGIWQMNMQLVEVERIYREVEDGRGQGKIFGYWDTSGLEFFPRGHLEPVSFHLQKTVFQFFEN